MQNIDMKRGCFSQTDNKSSLLMTGLMQLIVYEDVKLVPAGTLTLMLQCPPYWKGLCKLHKVNVWLIVPWSFVVYLDF